MQKTILTLALAMILMASCDHARTEDNNSSSTATTSATSGTWRVTLFSDSGNDETADFSGYNFTFSTAGTVAAVRSGNTTNGTWSVTSNKFNIDLGPKTTGNKPLGELTDDWKILSASATEIRLADDNTSSAEFLTFTKN